MADICSGGIGGGVGGWVVGVGGGRDGDRSRVGRRRDGGGGGHLLTAGKRSAGWALTWTLGAWGAKQKLERDRSVNINTGRAKRPKPARPLGIRHPATDLLYSARPPPRPQSDSGYVPRQGGQAPLRSCAAMPSRLHSPGARCPAFPDADGKGGLGAGLGMQAQRLGSWHFPDPNLISWHSLTDMIID